ncbi:retropepsin-like aspartic protease [Flexithrix dorotheae]|uniref:retropepsin-like aspartic protease n=1 Tax=Flexithrix dorotheae TaxID=70993 RepID=UPI00035CEA8E|nr:retropepsin-like aspartic protease [Flexithrix dorotheae]
MDLTQISIKDFLIQKGYLDIQVKPNKVGLFEVVGKFMDKEMTFLIDTGASNTVLNLELAESFDLQIEELDTPGGGVGTSEAKVYQVDSSPISIQGFNFADFELLAIDFTHINLSLQAKEIDPVDGVIGADLLNKYAAIIDYKTSTLFLMED